ncbi:MAG: hypothetical protein V8R46_01800 [Eubacterium ramulus]
MEPCLVMWWNLPMKNILPRMRPEPYICRRKGARSTFFACVETDAMDSQIYGYIGEPDTTGKMQQLLQYVQEHAVQYRDIGVTSQDSVIALSTCAESATNGRVVLFGKLQESSDNKQK